MLHTIKQDWLSNIRGDVLAGTVVALALIPESISFSIIAGVDPKVGLYAAFCIAVVTSIAGGRPGMISAATGAMAVLFVSLVKDHGLQYLLAATILCGLLQVLFGYLKISRLMKYVTKPVVHGFLNALAIMIFTTQLVELVGVTHFVYPLVALGLAIIYAYPTIPVIGKLVPSPLVSILVITAITVYLGIDVRTVGDKGVLPDTLPVFLLPQIPLNLETLFIILPYSLSMAVVGLLESLMTKDLLDDITGTVGDSNRECKGQGLANITAGFMGGMAGCAMVGQSLINMKSGGRGRLSCLVAGILLIVLVIFFSDFVNIIPMPALVAVMIMVSISSFQWESITNIKNSGYPAIIVTIVTMAVVLLTHNLAVGVLAGSILAFLFRYFNSDPEGSTKLV